MKGEINMNTKEILQHINTRPEVCVTFNKDSKEKGYPIFYFFPIEFITDRQPKDTALYQRIFDVTGSKRSAIAAVRWAINAKHGETKRAKTFEMSID